MNNKEIDELLNDRSPKSAADLTSILKDLGAGEMINGMKYLRDSGYKDGIIDASGSILGGLAIVTVIYKFVKSRKEKKKLKGINFSSAKEPVSIELDSEKIDSKMNESFSDSIRD